MKGRGGADHSLRVGWREEGKAMSNFKGFGGGP